MPRPCFLRLLRSGAISFHRPNLSPLNGLLYLEKLSISDSDGLKQIFNLPLLTQFCFFGRGLNLIEIDYPSLPRLSSPEVSNNYRVKKVDRWFEVELVDFEIENICVGSAVR
jgi:hypothetical protein